LVLKPTPESKSLVTVRLLGTRLLTLVAGLERLHQSAGPAASCLLALQPQRRHLRLPERLVAFHISLAGRHGHRAQPLQQTLWLLVVELERLRQQSQPERVLSRHWALILVLLVLLLLTVERSALHLAARSQT
jgi:hypothetical protein